MPKISRANVGFPSGNVVTSRRGGGSGVFVAAFMNRRQRGPKSISHVHTRAWSTGWPKNTWGTTEEERATVPCDTFDSTRPRLRSTLAQMRQAPRHLLHSARSIIGTTSAILQLGDTTVWSWHGYVASTTVRYELNQISPNREEKSYIDEFSSNKKIFCYFSFCLIFLDVFWLKGRIRGGTKIVKCWLCKFWKDINFIISSEYELLSTCHF